MDKDYRRSMIGGFISALVLFLFCLALASCATRKTTYTTPTVKEKKYKVVKGNEAHFKRRAEIKAKRKALKKVHNN